MFPINVKFILNKKFPIQIKINKYKKIPNS